MANPAVNNSHGGPAVQRAYDVLCRHLSRGTWPPGAKLPPIKMLAKSANVSVVSMSKALAALKVAEMVDGCARRRFRAGNGDAAEIGAPEPDGLIWRLKRRELEKDILSGAFVQQGALPSHKELEARYGVNFRTMRKILRSMVDDGGLRLAGRAYKLPGNPIRSGTRRIVFITHRSLNLVTSALNPGQFRVLEELEHECSRRNLDLDVFYADFYEPADLRRLLSGRALRAPSLGYLVDVWWHASEAYRQTTATLLSRLAATKRPVGILDEFRTFVLPSPVAENPLFQVFTIEESRAGAKVARALLGLGHSSIAFVSSMHDTPWSMGRLEGVRAQYAGAGCEAGVHPVVNTLFGSSYEQLLYLSGFDDKLVRRIMAIDRTPSQAEDSFAVYVRYRNSMSARPRASATSGAVRQALSGLSAVAGLHLDPLLFNGIAQRAIEEAGARMSAAALKPLWEKALSHRDVTAWICGNDTIALAALAFLGHRGIRVPADLSVVGFDNIPVKTLEARLTSFDFNARGFAYQMLEFVVRPPVKRGRHRHRPIEIEGRVMVRGTTGRPREKAWKGVAGT